MKLIKILSSALVLAVAHGAALRGSHFERLLDDATMAPTAEGTGDNEYLDTDGNDPTSTDYTGLQLCTKAHSSPANNKYFWISMVNSDKTVLGSCLVALTDENEVCCTLQGTVSYTTNNGIVVSDPVTISNTTSPAYAACGKDGGYACPDYSFANNEQGMGYIEVKDSSNTSLRKPDKFIHKQGDSKCGLGDSLGNADCSGAWLDVYGDFHVGKGDCLESTISLSKYCSGHYGYKCKQSNCS